MRIRQVRPEFWQDEEVAGWPEGLRLFYIGLWGVCDDAGYFEFVPQRIAALLYPYEARRRRETKVGGHLTSLVIAEKIRRLEGCEHAIVPTLAVHQKTGGQPSYTVKKAHDGERRMPTDIPVSNGRERYVTVGGGTGGLKERLGSYEEIVKPTATP